MLEGIAQLPKFDGCEVQEGITLIGEPSPVPGSAKLRCLANVYGCLAVVELSLRFACKDPKEILK